METVFNGYNCSVFAYGTTGARKNLHDAGWEGENSNVVPTLLGANVESSGLSRYHLPDHGGNLQENISTLDDKTCEVEISYLEVYNETVRDLLTTERRETPPPFRV